MAKQKARTLVYKNKKRRDKGLNGSKKRLKVKNAELANVMEEFRLDSDKWKAEAEKLTK